MTSTFMAAEIAEAGDRLAQGLSANHKAIEDLGRRVRALNPPFVATNARGSSDHAAAALKFLVETRLGLPCASLGPSIASLYRRPLRMAGGVLFSFSQSGRSPDIVAMQAATKSAGGLTIALVNDESSPLAQQADVLLPLRAGPERSVAATKSALSCMGIAAALVASWQEDDGLAGAIAALPSAMNSSARPPPEAMFSALREAQSLFVVGRGATLPLAAEAALKLKETCAIHAEAFSTAEVLHGPAGMVRRGFPVLAFLPQDEARAGTLDTVMKLAAFGAAPLVIDTSAHAVWPTLVTPDCGNPIATAIASLHGFYRLVEALARRRGRDPDTPPHLQKVTQTV
jgi:glutamine---fructose-6-phosphate transaminase (isomerizing)